MQEAATTTAAAAAYPQLIYVFVPLCLHWVIEQSIT